ncbi:MAG: hypothetical protein AMJ88_06815 [Anaerolineae bacterium SM23_ 63]|nr:MAG: hypothetical protein AMJ88_06815 [Anaerolineae bacterium SM23_ 63]HEY46845.1 hypothetical protein [Anaerolineae bacterium]
MADENYQLGKLVTFVTGDWAGLSGVVSWLITKEDAGYVLVCLEGQVAGVPTSFEEIVPADEAAKGFTQLAYQLIKLSSLLIETAIM